MASATRRIKDLAKPAVAGLVRRLPERQQIALKEYFELRFWQRLHAEIDNDPESQHLAALERAHFRQFYTEFFGLDEARYRGADILDIGCGPMGSLEWADMARRRVGLDPLSEQYLALGADAHAMEYVTGTSEDLPFADASFDVVASFNNLDHVADVPSSAREIIRVTRPGGDILLIAEICHAPTFTEPHKLDRDVIGHFANGVSVISERVYGVRDDHNLYAGLMEKLPHEPGQPGVLCVHFRKHDAGRAASAVQETVGAAARSG